MRRKGVFFLIIFFWFSLAQAQEPAALEKNPIVCHGDKVEFLEDQQRLVATGHALVIYEDIKMTCDKIGISMNTKDSLAEGNVVVYQKDSVLTADRAEYNFNTQTGVLYNGNFASQVIYGRGPRAIQEDPNTIDMPHSYMTSCDLAQPHYRVQSRTAKIFLEDKIVMRDVVFYMFELPAMYLPYYSYSLKPENRPKVSVFPGKDKDWGYYLLTKWRYEFNQYLKGILHLDYRERKDFASGFDNYYETDNLGNGFIKAYYMNERTLEENHPWNQPRISHERERYMVQQRHSWDIDPETDLRMEYWNVSDTDMLKDYFYRNDYERYSAPVTYLSVIRTMPDYSLSLLEQKRTSEVFTQLEYQPELRFTLPDLKIGSEQSQFYWRSENSFANISRKYACPSDLDEDAVRVDSYNQIKRISKLGFLSVTPYVGARESYYSKDKYGDHDWFRGALYTGVDVETKFFRVFPLSTNKWDLDINNLRHVITPRVGYSYIHTPTIVPEKLFQFDGLDGIDRQDRLSFSLENKLQTKRQDDPVDLAILTVSTYYDYRLPSGSKFSDINFDFEFTPFNWLTLECDASYDHIEDMFKTFNFDFFINQEDKWRTGFGYRYAHEDHSEATFELSFKPTPLWQLGIYENFMFKGYPNSLKKINDLRQQEYRIIRDLHCWTSEILYTLSRGEGESIYLIFRLKASPQSPLEFGNSYHRPKEYSQNWVR